MVANVELQKKFQDVEAKNENQFKELKEDLATMRQEMMTMIVWTITKMWNVNDRKEKITCLESSKEGESCLPFVGPHRKPFMDNTMCNHVPKIHMNKFDESNVASWITQLEHYFSIQHITNDMAKLKVEVLYLDLERWQLWWWHKKSYGGYLAWTQFAKSLTAHFDRESHFWVSWLNCTKQVL